MKVAVDVGGTFTDVLALDDSGELRSAKLQTEPDDLAHCFLAAVRAVQSGAPGVGPDEFLYGTTHALNALLAHRLPAVGLIVTRGFRELLETARLPDPREDESLPRGPAPERLVPLERIREVGARMDAQGGEDSPLDPDEVADLARGYRRLGISVVAVSLLHSYVDDRHERAIAGIFAAEAPEIEVVQSSQVLPELREYERTLATCLTACLRQLMRSHVEDISRSLGGAPFWIMKSSGGLGEATTVSKEPLASALSGPAAAVVGVSWLGRRMGIEDLISLDMGGTSTDVALVRAGDYQLTTRGEIAGFPWKAPMIDLTTLGAGGGSVASMGADKRWRIGPESAGAVPGPVCYGAGGEQVTLSDAELVLGRLPEALLGGELALDADRARSALSEFGASRGVGPERAARGILEIASHQICGAIRRVSVLRGHDPKAYALFGVGGAGPLHAAEVAALLGIEQVVIPPQPGLAAAHGLLVADIRGDFVRALGGREEDADPVRIEADFAALEALGQSFLAEQVALEGRGVLQRSVDLRYRGMLYETTIPWTRAGGPVASIEATVEAFHAHYEGLTGHSQRGGEAVELLNLRVTAIAERDKLGLSPSPDRGSGTPEPREMRRVGFLHQRNLLESAIYDRDSLGNGATVSGPAVIEQRESTIIVPPEFRAAVDDLGNVVMGPIRAQSPRGA